MEILVGVFKQSLHRTFVDLDQSARASNVKFNFLRCDHKNRAAKRDKEPPFLPIELHRTRRYVSGDILGAESVKNHRGHSVNVVFGRAKRIKRRRWRRQRRAKISFCGDRNRMRGSEQAGGGGARGDGSTRRDRGKTSFKFRLVARALRFLKRNDTTE